MTCRSFLPSVLCSSPIKSFILRVSVKDTFPDRHLSLCVFCRGLAPASVFAKHVALLLLLLHGRRERDQIKESDNDVEVPQSFFTTDELERLMEETKPEWLPASSYFAPEEGAAGKIGRGGLFVEEPATGTRLRRLNNGEKRDRMEGLREETRREETLVSKKK